MSFNNNKTNKVRKHHKLGGKSSVQNNRVEAWMLALDNQSRASLGKLFSILYNGRAHHQYSRSLISMNPIHQVSRYIIIAVMIGGMYIHVVGYGIIS